MKMNVWLILGVMLATSVLAKQTTDAPATTSTAAPAAPVKTEKKAAPKSTKKGAKKSAQATSGPALIEKPVSLSPGTGIITGNHVNVRGQPTIYSEAVTQLNSGDPVKVIEEVIRETSKPGDPTQWAKINVPSGVNVWVHSAYIDATNHVVLPRKLNVRAGPGENYSIVGLLERGAAVKEISTKGRWIEIEPPADAYAFVAAMYVKQEGKPAAVPPVVSIAPPETIPAPTPAVVPEPAPVASTTTEPPASTVKPTPAPITPAPTPAVTPAPTTETTPTPAVTTSTPAPETETVPPAYEEPPPKRIVEHEGIVKGTWSIQAPTKFELVDPVSGKTVNYLYTSSTNLNLSLYKGLHIIVTGEEGLDERWKNTPVITIQRIQVLQ